MSDGNASPILDESGRPLHELHGVTLVQIVEYLVSRLGFPQLALHIPVNCFSNNPTLKSSLVFLRRTPWARAKVEALYIEVRTEELRVYALTGPAPKP
jgi:uncharacterized protein (DUF2132 family)